MVVNTGAARLLPHDRDGPGVAAEGLEFRAANDQFSQSLLKASTSAFTFKTLLRHYAEWAITIIGAFSVIVKTN